MAKRGPLDAFLGQAATKKPRTGQDCSDSPDSQPPSAHLAYPHPIDALPPSLALVFDQLPSSPSRPLPTRPNLDTLYFAPLIAREDARALFRHLRQVLPFYRVQYSIVRGDARTTINTPRFTTVFGVDDSARFDTLGRLVSHPARSVVAPGTYKRTPRPLPASLDALRKAVERATGARYNFCLVNYYADGSDSISYHSDDEHFLGPNPCIASLSLGGVRDFLLRPKSDKHPAPADTIKLPLESGDMIVMRGSTQSNWLHSIPKRKGDQGKQGRINITFRRALIRQGTDNYYCYNVGDGPVWRWDDACHAMKVWRPDSAGTRATDQTGQQTVINWR